MVWKTLNQSYISVPVYPAESIKTLNGFIKFWTQNDFLMQALLANKAPTPACPAERPQAQRKPLHLKACFSPRRPPLADKMS